MRYYVGIDGGGSKTRFACIDEKGRTIAEYLCGGTYYRQLGADAVEQRLLLGVKAVTEKLNEQPAAISFGMPGYGEAMPDDEVFVARMREAFHPIPFFAANDVAMAFYGAFAGNSGILLVAGTGSMAWGQDDGGDERRCGGWSHHFGDEGSGFWVGRRALELFTKESDGRMPKTVFHSMLRDQLSVPAHCADIEIVAQLENLFRERGSVAAVHRVLHEAALRGDEAAEKIYDEAAEELAAIVLAMARDMSFAGTVPVSYVGGMFKCEKFILEPVKARVEAALDANFSPPLSGPCHGAALYAASELGDGEYFAALRDAIIESEAESV